MSDIYGTPNNLRLQAWRDERRFDTSSNKPFSVMYMALEACQTSIDPVVRQIVKETLAEVAELQG
jgi:hypothetical protein